LKIVNKGQVNEATKVIFDLMAEKNFIY